MSCFLLPVVNNLYPEHFRRRTSLLYLSCSCSLVNSLSILASSSCLEERPRVAVLEDVDLVVVVFVFTMMADCSNSNSVRIGVLMYDL